MREMDRGRSRSFQRDNRLEQVLKELNDYLADIQQEINKRYSAPRYPLILIVGSPRSGSTLLTQWLSGLGLFGYPTNLSSRFFAAPYIGARIQQALCEYDSRGEVFGHQTVDSFQSELGKTRGPLEPHEFWYFWRRFFKFGEIQVVPEEELAKVDTERLLAELASFEAASGKPLVMKGMNLNWHIPFLNKCFDKILFLFTKRQPVYNAQSLLQARKKFFSTYERWYSFKPPEYEELAQMDVYRQVMGQVYYTNRAVSKGLETVPAGRKLVVDYNEFCQSPGTVFDALVERLNAEGCELEREYDGVDGFDHTDRVKLPGDEFERLQHAYETFYGRESNRD